MKNNNTNQEFRRECLENFIQQNNPLALFYVMKRSGLCHLDYIPGTQKTYMHRAIEFGADAVVKQLLDRCVNPNGSVRMKDSYLECVLKEEEKLLSLEKKTSSHEGKMERLLLIAATLLKSGASISKNVAEKLNSTNNSTPVLNVIRDYNLRARTL